MSVHHAPPVVYPVRRAILPVILAIAVWLFGLTLFAVWRSGSPEFDWRARMLVFLLAATAAVIVWRVGRQGASRLYWDGANWSWQADGTQMESVAMSLTVVADFQRLIIVSLTLANGRRVWLGIHRSDFPERWLDCRRAIHLPGRPVAIPEPAVVAPVGASRPVAVSETAVEPEKARTRFN